jgi:hypothetical protein
MTEYKIVCAGLCNCKIIHEFCNQIIRTLKLITTLSLFGFFYSSLQSQISSPPGARTEVDTGSTTVSDTSVMNNQLKIDPAYLSFKYMQLGVDSFAKWDSLFAFSHRYNRHYQRVQPFTDLGYSTSPHQILRNPSLQKFGFQSGFSIYEGTDIKPEETVFYKAPVPQTSFDYVQGSGAFIELNTMHTQNFSPTWNLTLRLNNHSNNDELYNTQSNTNHIHRGSSVANAFKTKNGVFEQYSIFSWNRARRNESFGYDTTADREYYLGRTEGPLYQNVGFYSPNLTGAGSIYKTHHHMILNKWNITPSSYLFYTLKHQKTSYEFTNNGTNDSSILGSHGFFETTRTEDSSVWQQWNNVAGIGGDLLKQKLLYQASFEQTRASFTTRYKNSSDLFYQSAIHGKLYSHPHHLSHQNIQAEASFLVAGAQSGDYYLKSRASQQWRNWILHAGLDLQNRTAFQKQTRWQTNFYGFNTELKKTQVQNIKFGISGALKHLTVASHATLGNANNVNYLDSTVQYNQTGPVQSFRLNTTLNLALGKWHFDHRILYQTNSANEVLNIPQVTLMSSIYYQNTIFKKTLLARIGADFYYQSKNKAYRYIASAAAFALTNENAGNNPIADVFINGKVKNFDFFVKAEYWNSFLVLEPFAKTFNSSLYEPTIPFNIKLGISWRFFN